TGTVDVFVRGTDSLGQSSLYLLRHSSSGWAWTGPIQPGGVAVAGDPTAYRDGQGTTFVEVLGADGSLHVLRAAAGNSGYSTLNDPNVGRPVLILDRLVGTPTGVPYPAGGIVTV